VSEVPDVLSDRLMRENVIITVERTQRSGGCVELRADIVLAQSICLLSARERTGKGMIGSLLKYM
jgi:hypothetical protein